MAGRGTLKLWATDIEENVKEYPNDHQTDAARNPPDDPIGLVILLGESRAGRGKSASPALLELFETHAALHDHRLIEWFFSRRGWSWRRGCAWGRDGGRC